MKVISWSILPFFCLAALSLQPIESLSQMNDQLKLVTLSGDTIAISTFDTRGYKAASHLVLEEMGWEVEVDSNNLRAVISDSESVHFVFGSPFFRWNDKMFQLVNAPSLDGSSGNIPIQFFLDFVPMHLGGEYVFAEEQFPAVDQESDSNLEGQGVQPELEIELEPDIETGESGNNNNRRIVIIDPGHGGKDPGTTGSGGRREKDIALSVSRELVRELGKDDGIEVYMTRDRDVFVPLWERGEQAMFLKGEDTAIFLSIHVNAAPNNPSVRGFETYFLSEARTEHERRVAANENAPLAFYSGEENASESPDLDFILRELRNLDHQHWSANLAETIQKSLRVVHSGPDRGVKQGPFAVITNVLMPAVLVEIGFVSNREEEREMSRSEFQRELGKALADAVREFYNRYPPGQQTVGRGGEC